MGGVVNKNLLHRRQSFYSISFVFKSSQSGWVKPKYKLKISKKKKSKNFFPKMDSFQNAHEAFRELFDSGQRMKL